MLSWTALVWGNKPCRFARIMRKSMCDRMDMDPSVLGYRRVRGICEQADSSITSHLSGIETGESVYGDVVAWFSELLEYPSARLIANATLLSEATEAELMRQIRDKVLTALSEKMPVGFS
nr:unnamed protein product [Leishmania braziliensis]